MERPGAVGVVAVDACPLRVLGGPRARLDRRRGQLRLGRLGLVPARRVVSSSTSSSRSSSRIAWRSVSANVSVDMPANIGVVRRVQASRRSSSAGSRRHNAGNVIVRRTCSGRRPASVINPSSRSDRSRNSAAVTVKPFQISAYAAVNANICSRPLPPTMTGGPPGRRGRDSRTASGKVKNRPVNDTGPSWRSSRVMTASPSANPGEPGRSITQSVAEHLVLALHPPGPDPEDHPPPAEVVDRGGLAGEHHRVPERQRRNWRPEVHPGRVLGGVGQGDDQLQAVQVDRHRQREVIGPESFRQTPAAPPRRAAPSAPRSARPCPPRRSTPRPSPLLPCADGFGRHLGLVTHHRRK